MAFGDDLSGTVQVARPSIVTESLPRLQDLILVGLGECLDGWEPLEPGFVVPQHRFNPGLLQHDLGYQYPVWIGVPPPGQIARGSVVMVQQGTAKPGYGISGD